MMAQKANPFLHEVVMLMTLTPEYPVVTSWAQSKDKKEKGSFMKEDQRRREGGVKEEREGEGEGEQD